MAQAKSGDTVCVHYTGKFEDGSVFDSSQGRGPLEITLGEGQLISGFEKALVGMEPGESKKAEIPSDEAYGQHRDDMVMAVDREHFPDDITPEVGQRLTVTRPDGNQMPVTVTEVTDSDVTLDANHPLAGKDLTFEIELIEIK